MGDQLREKQRLAQLYAAMSDAELLRMADNPASLTDAALDALEDEAERRGLRIDFENNTATAAPEYSRLVVIRNFRGLPEAWVAKGALAAAGVESHLLDENMVRLGYPNAVGGVRLCVREPDAARAYDVLNHPQEPLPAEEDHATAEYQQQPRCPTCGSRDIKLGGSSGSAGYITISDGVPILLRTLRWKCNACGNRWEEQ